MNEAKELLNDSIENFILKGQIRKAYHCMVILFYLGYLDMTAYGKEEAWGEAVKLVSSFFIK